MNEPTHLRKRAQDQPHQSPDVGERRVTVRVTDVCAAGVQDRAYGEPREGGVITHGQQDAVQMLSQFHWLKQTSVIIMLEQSY